MCRIDGESVMDRKCEELVSLIGARSPEQFLDEVWERDVALYRGARTARDEVLTLEQFEALAASAACEASQRLHVVDKVARPLAKVDDEASAVAKLFRLYGGGRTLLLLDVQQQWQPVARWCRALERELLALGVPLAQRIGANAYLTPPRSQGFDLHYDDHCVFVVQLSGAKQWQVCAPAEELPVARCTPDTVLDGVGPPILEAELTPGDVLYIPRGFPHAARTGNSSSLHLTLSWQTITWVSLVHEALRDHPELRRSVPRTRPGDDAQHALERALREAAQIDDLNERLERRIDELVARLVPVPHGRISAIDGAALVSEHTRVRRVDGAVCAVQLEGDQVALRIPGTTLRLPAMMKDALTFVAQSSTFSPAELPRGQATFDAVELVRVLVIEGLVEMVLAASHGGTP